MRAQSQRNKEAVIVEEHNDKVKRLLDGEIDEAEIAADPKMIQFASQLARDEVYIWGSLVNLKAAWYGRVDYYHQDFANYKPRGYKQATIVNCFTFLDHHNINNAALHVFPGSHKEGILPFEERKSYREDKDDQPGNTLKLPKHYLDKKTDVIMKKGDMLIDLRQLFKDDSVTLSQINRYENNIERLKEYHRDYRDRNFEELKLKKQEYIKNNPDLVRKRKKNYREVNKEEISKREKEYRYERREYIKEWKKKNYEENKEKILAQQKIYYKNNIEKFILQSRKRDKQLQEPQRPSWCSTKIIHRIYEKAYLLRNEDNQDVVVDHIVPLNGYSVELGQYSVCGLHVENNLRIISNKENSSKNNLFEPCSDAELPPCEIELDLSLLD